MISCTKYNYGLETTTQKTMCMQAFLQLSRDFKYLKIINRKVNQATKYILEADQEIIHNARINEHAARVQSLKDVKTKYNKDHELYDPAFMTIESSASTYISDVNGMIFGGVHSRFWMFRKHFNSMSPYELRDVPFHSWECITL